MNGPTDREKRTKNTAATLLALLVAGLLCLGCERREDAPKKTADACSQAAKDTCSQTAAKPQRAPKPEAAMPQARPELPRPDAAVRAEIQNPATGRLELSDAPPPRELAEGCEVIVVSGYEPTDVERSGATSKVVVERPGKKVMLVLTSYHTMQWTVEAAPRTEIAAILVSSYGDRTEVSVNEPSRGFLVPRLPYVTDPDNVNFVNLLAGLHRLFGIDRVDALRGAYGIPPEVVVSAPDPLRPELTLAGPQPQRAESSPTFSLLTPDGRKASWSASGPEREPDGAAAYLDAAPLALSPDGNVLYTLENNRLQACDLQGGSVTSPELPPNFPRFSWPSGVAYDSRRDLVSVVSFGGDGCWYRYDVKAGKWLDFRSLNGIDFGALSYDEQSDRYVAHATLGRDSLLFVSGELEPLFERPLKDKLDGLSRLYDRNNGPSPVLRLFPRGDDIVLACFVGSDFPHVGGGAQAVRALWHYDVRADRATLTYRNDAGNGGNRP